MAAVLRSSVEQRFNTLPPFATTYFTPPICTESTQITQHDGKMSSSNAAHQHPTQLSLLLFERDTGIGAAALEDATEWVTTAGFFTPARTRLKPPLAFEYSPSTNCSTCSCMLLPLLLFAATFTCTNHHSVQMTIILRLTDLPVASTPCSSPLSPTASRSFPQPEKAPLLLPL